MKNVMSDRKTRKKMGEKAELTVVSEHFETIFDAVFLSVIVFQQAC